MNMDATPMDLYESLAEASARMREAARCSHWEELMRAEDECASLVERLRALPVQDLDAEGRTRKRALLRGILSDDAEVRAHLMPWMRRLEALIGDARAQRSAASRYET